MNPSSGENLPTPQFEVPPPSEGSEQQHDQRMEQAGQSESGAGKQQPAALNTAVLQLPTDIPVADPVALPTDDKDDKDPKDPYPEETAQDTHRIEVQWVDRAKKVIAQTKDDPRTQKIQMSQVKAEYIRKRFNKTIPTDAAPKQ